MAKPKTKRIKVLNRVILDTSRGRLRGPILTPYKETTDAILYMISKNNAEIVEVLPDGTEVPLDISNFAEDHGKKMPVKEEVAIPEPKKEQERPLSRKERRALEREKARAEEEAKKASEPVVEPTPEPEVVAPVVPEEPAPEVVDEIPEVTKPINENPQQEEVIREDSSEVSDDAITD